MMQRSEIEMCRLITHWQGPMSINIQMEMK